MFLSKIGSEFFLSGDQMTLESDFNNRRRPIIYKKKKSIFKSVKL